LKDGCVVEVKSIVWLVVLFIGACGGLNRVDTQATLQIENQVLATEAAESAQRVIAFQTEVQATAQAAETFVVEMNNINSQLVVTVRAGRPATPGAIVANRSGTIRFGTTMAGTSVDGRGCVDAQQRDYFLGTFSRIFISAQAFNVQAGSRIAVEYREEGIQMLRESWILDQSINGDCIWTTFDAGRLPLTPGKRWTAQFFVDGQPVQPPVVFVIGSERESDENG